MLFGLSEPATLDAAVRGGASYVGFVFFSKSPRNVTGEQAAMLASRVADHVGRVGVFVDPDDAQVKETAAAARLTANQLHGDESPARAAAIKGVTGLGVGRGEVG